MKMNMFLFLLTLSYYTNRLVANKTVLRIGGLFQTMPTPSGNENLAYATKSALEFVNSHEDILAEYDLVMVANYTSFDVNKMTADALGILYDFIYEKPQFHMLVVSTISMVAQPVCEVASHYNLIQVSGLASSPGLSDKNRYPLFLRFYPSDTILVPGWEALLRYFQWKRVAIVYEDIEIFSLLMKELVSLLEEHGGYDVLTVEHVQTEFEPTNQIKSLKSHNARIIILLAYPETTRQTICQAYKANLYGKKYLWMMLGWLNDEWFIRSGDVSCSITDMKHAVNGYLSIKVLPYTQDFNQVNYHGVTPSQEDLEVYEQLQSKSYYAGFVYDTIVSLAIALDNAEALLSRLDPPRRLLEFTYQDAEMAHYVKDSVQHLHLDGVTGRIEFTATGDRISELIIEQMQDEKLVQVGVYDVGHDEFRWSNDTAIQWQEKLPPTDGVKEIRSTVLPSYTARLIMYTLASCGILFAILCLVLNIKFRNQKVIKISSPFLNNFILVGCILLYVLIILYGIDTSSMSSLQFSIQCHARPILLSIGLSLAFGALFMKTYRVYAIFKIAMEKFMEIRVGDSRLILGVVAMVILDVVISTSWILCDPISSTVNVLETRAQTDENAHDFLYIYQTRNCYSAYTLYWTLSLFVIKGILLFLGVFLAWAIRSVQVAALNESRQIALSIYVVALVCVIVAFGQYFLKSKVTTVYVITGSGIFFANTLVLCLAFVPKIILLYLNPHDVNTSTVKSGQQNKFHLGRGRFSSRRKSEKKPTLETLKESLGVKLQTLALLKKSYKQLCMELLSETDLKTT